MSDDQDRASYAGDVLGVLFPGASVTATGGDDVGTRTFAFAPSVRRPRLLVPVRPRDAAASALRGFGGRLTRRARWTSAGLTRTLATVGPAPLRTRLTVSPPASGRAGGIDDHLSNALGREVSVAVHLTPARANRKPIVQAVAAGEPYPLAFSKIAVDPLTWQLIDREATTLVTLADRVMARLVVPRVTHDGEFEGHRVLTMEPLPTWLPGRSPSIKDVAAAGAEIGSLAGSTRIPLQDSGFWQRVQERSSELPDTPRAERLVRCIESLTRELGEREVTFSASHGDWSPWNMWMTSRGLLVWDWERFETETPEGFDLLHFRLNDQLVRGGWSQPEAGHRLVAEAADVLGLGGGTDPPLHTVLLYLVNLGVRYETDQQAAAGATIGRLENWLLPALEAGVADPTLARRA